VASRSKRGSRINLGRHLNNTNLYVCTYLYHLPGVTFGLGFSLLACKVAVQTIPITWASPILILHGLIRAWFYELRIRDAALGVRPIWAYDSEKPDIYKEPERFAKVITGYDLMTDSELGLNTFVEREGNYKQIAARGMRIDLEDKPIASQKAIV
jgi:hypothetical protein